MTTATTPHEGMTLAQFTAAREAMRGALAQFERVKPNCHSCQHFYVGECRLHGAQIPGEFQNQVEACPDWAWDSIPFASSDFVHDMVTSKQRRMRSYDF